MVSDIGKALNPITDKLTQVVTLICLLIDFPRLAILLFGLVAITFVIMCMSFAMYYVQKKKYMKENIEY